MLAFEPTTHTPCPMYDGISAPTSPPLWAAPRDRLLSLSCTRNKHLFVDFLLSFWLLEILSLELSLTLASCPPPPLSPTSQALGACPPTADLVCAALSLLRSVDLPSLLSDTQLPNC